jgi:gamma-glutamyltranspeptidase/glutathione hydrolase
MEFEAAASGGRPVGVPGAVALMWEVHRADGKLPWKRLFEPALRLAEQGFAVSPRLAAAIAEAAELGQDESARALYFTQSATGQAAVPAGHTVKNPAYAATLRAIAERGRDGFYSGEVALAILAAVNGHAASPGDMTASDLASYRALPREPVCRPYRSYRICGMPPPTSGGLTTLMILGLLEPYRMEGLRPLSPTAVHLLASASRLAFADRDLYIADPDFAPVPVEGLLSDGYLTARAKLIDQGEDDGKAQAGDPALPSPLPRAAALSQPESGTSHLAVIDAFGNALSMTTSVEQSFGARIMAGGFVLNNQLTDFSFVPERDGKPVANRVEGGKRPRSSMSPTVVFAPDGEVFAVVGSPGGSRIIGYVTETLIGLIDWRLDMQAAIDLPHALNRNGATELEQGTSLVTIAPRLKAMGHEVKLQPMPSGLQGIRIVGGVLDGGADRRREGTIVRVPAPAE